MAKKEERSHRRGSRRVEEPSSKTHKYKLDRMELKLEIRTLPDQDRLVRPEDPTLTGSRHSRFQAFNYSCAIIPERMYYWNHWSLEAQDSTSYLMLSSNFGWKALSSQGSGGR